MKNCYITRQLPKLLLLMFVVIGMQAFQEVLSQSYSFTKRPNENLHLRLNGFLEALPPDYAANPGKDYPLLIFVHRQELVGVGDNTSLGLLENEVGIPSMITNGTFPDNFTVDGVTHSFIVVAPQLNTAGHNSSYGEAIDALIEECKTRYRVDESRIYLTGIAVGGGVVKRYIGTYPEKAAAAVITRGANVLDNTAQNVATDNLPTWLTHNRNDPSVPHYYSSTNWTTIINGSTPLPSPLAKLTSFISSLADSWTTTYDPAYKEDGMNIYEWMLQYSNPKLQPNAGPDQGFTKTATSHTTSFTLDGSKSRARGGRITGYSWSQLSGATSATITNSTSQTATVTGLTVGIYEFQLTVTHTDATTATDVVRISTQTFQKFPDVDIHPRIQGYVEALPTEFHNSPSKKYPLIIFVHGSGKIGTGTDTDLQKVIDEGGIPNLIKTGTFPDKVSAGGKEYSFIVEAPQITNNPANSEQFGHAVNNFLTTILAKYPNRIDESRIYITGLSMGGGTVKRYTAMFPQKIAAALITAATSIGNYADSTKLVAASNLPYWSTHNNDDAPVYHYYSTAYWRNPINAYVPAPRPLAKHTTMYHSGHNSWSETYSPTYMLDGTNNLNCYQWMLQYTNDKLVANAGPDKTVLLSTVSVSLDSRLSMARGNPGTLTALVDNRVASNTWTQISGPSSSLTGTSSPNALVSVTGLAAVGAYEFELTVTHSADPTLISKDTVLVTVTASSPRQAGPEDKLEPVDASKEILDLKLNPNPVRSNLTVFVSGKATGNASLALYNLRGQKVSQQQFNKPSGQTVARNVPVSNLPTGAYAIQVIIAGKTKTIQFIKE